MAAYRYAVVTPGGRHIEIAFNDSDLTATPIPRVAEEPEFMDAINRRFPAGLQGLEAAMKAAGAAFERLI